MPLGSTLTEVMGDLELLRLHQLMDSQLPVGSFAHSWGLEAYAARGLLDDRTLEGLLRVALSRGGLRLEGAACALAHGAALDLEAMRDLAHLLDAWMPIAGPRETSLRIGGRLARLLQRIHGLAWPMEVPPHQALVAGWAGRHLGIPLRPLLLLYIQNGLLALMAAATRTGALSPERAQEILVGLQGRVVEVAQEVLEDPQASLWSSTPGWDLRAAEQPHLETRLFLS
ncbi:hypothetical protein Thermus77420_20570 [Thermus thalpophilus]